MPWHTCKMARGDLPWSGKKLRTKMAVLSPPGYEAGNRKSLCCICHNRSRSHRRRVVQFPRFTPVNLLPAKGTSVKLRESNLDKLGQRVFDVLVIGGGINGAVSAAALAAQGAKVALIDKGDFASFTSQESSN